MSSFAANLDLSTLDGTNGFRIGGLASGDRGGWSVASAGDVNGDGIDDLIIGATQADANGTSSGASYVVFGKDTATDGDFLATLDLSTMDGTNGFRIIGAAAFDLSGYSVASAGDVNGDGIDDLIIGAPRADPNGAESGASYVVFGKDTAADGDFLADLDLSALDGTDGFRINGEAAGDWSGRSVASAGDVNGDGIDDLIIGAQYADPNGSNSGAAYVVFGSTTGFAANLNLSTLDGTGGFKISGVAANDLAGGSVASAGDVNGDGLGDLIIGASGADPNGSYSGASYVVFGSAVAFAANLDLSTLDGTTGFRISGAAAFDLSGYSVASAGDVNGDGIDDLIIGASGADPNGSSSGASYVLFGSAAGFGGNLDLFTLDGTNGFRISGVAAIDLSGCSVASAGDVNGDGIDDLIIGASRADPNGAESGASYLVFGSAAGFGGNLDLSTLDGTNGFKISGVAADDWTGSSVAAAGDVNGDGIDDLIVGANAADANASVSGAAYVIFGRLLASVIETGTPADDSYTGGALDDQLSGAGANDILNGLGGDDVLDGGDGVDQLYGGEGRDDLVGGDGGDLLDGGTGDDRMAGGAGNDTYVVDNTLDEIIEAAGQGSDRVLASATYTLADNLENLTLLGTADIGGRGNDLANVIDGNAGANLLRGEGGNDLIKGWDGADILNGGTGVDQLLGGDGADNLNGGADNDRLDGGAGDDTLLGGAGADLLEGGADNDVLTGGTGADQLFGGAGADLLDAGDGNDILDGGLGADGMSGGLGDDIFFVDDAGDTTAEAAGEGTDTVRATISWTLGDNLERLILAGSADLDGTGNGLANQLTGNAGANVLDGGAGADIISGGLGADRIIGGTGNDILTGGGGADTFVVRGESIYSSFDPQGRTVEVDSISDYQLGVDIIDLSAIDAGSPDGAFSLVAAFDGEAGRMVMKFAGGVTTLSLDIDGDSKADYLLKINGNVTGESGNWLL